jgi:CubicO group peptidase (beta-lactamase class C family)
MPTISRRTCLRRLALAASASAFPALLRPLSAASQETEAQTVPNDSQRAAIAAVARQFIEQYSVPGLSVAFARQGQTVFKEGFGLADKTSGDRVTPAHLFRIASVTKPITSVAIFSLIEEGRFKLDDLVFGSEGLLQFDFGRSLPSSVERITVHHLLTHTCGGWQNDGTDPMFHHPAMNHRDLIAWTIANDPLKNEPGTQYAYSNFGYCILGRIIEKFAKHSYPEFVRRQVLAKCGVTGMKIAGNTISERAAGEVVYYDRNAESPYRMNVARMDSHGGWIATPQDLLQFLTRVDGFSATRNILSERTIKTMTTPTAARPGYACGWSVNQVPNWWHGGSLPGSSTIAVRTASGLCWAGFANTRTDGIGPALDRLMWKIAAAVPAWRA